MSAQTTEAGADRSALYQQRLQRAREALAAAGVDALLLTPGADFFYLTGISVYSLERLLALIVPRQGPPFFLAPEMNRAQLAGAPGISQILTWSDTEWYQPAAARALAGRGLDGGVLAVDDEMRSAFLLDLQSVCPRARWQHSGEVMRRLRVRKDRAELDRLIRAAAIADAAIPAAHAASRPGQSEEAVSAAVRAAMEAAGGAGVSVYSVVVASGPNSTLPHHLTGGRTLQAGDVVVFDYGCREPGGYHSDISISLSLGPPDGERQRVYRAVWEAQQRVLEAIRPGVSPEALDRLAWETITAAGYGQGILHRTGHGIGLQVHEPPFLGPGNRQPLEEGMCFSVEPGIYLAGRFGVRLEVIVTVTASGARLLNAPSAPQFPVVGSNVRGRTGAP